MYLTREKYIGANYEHNQVKGIIDITVRGKKIPIDLKKVNCIRESVGYWRKANQIHKWFVDNVQDGNDDCKPYYVSTEDLEKLLNICKEVKEKAKLVDGKIKKALENVPDELEVELWSDSGVDQSDDDSEVVIEDAYRHQHTLPDGQTYEDGTNSIDYFVIYANYRDENEEEE